MAPKIKYEFLYSNYGPILYHLPTVIKIGSFFVKISSSQVWQQTTRQVENNVPVWHGLPPPASLAWQGQK